MPRARLTEKQEKFLFLYLDNGGVKSSAYREAYKSVAAPSVVVREADKLLKHPIIAARIRARTLSVTTRQEITMERTVRELAAIAYANPLQFMTFDAEGNPSVDLQKLTPEQAAAVSEIIIEEIWTGHRDKRKKGHKIRVKLHKKTEALALLGRYQGMFDDKPPPPPVDDGERSERRKKLRGLIMELANNGEAPLPVIDQPSAESEPEPSKSVEVKS